MGVVVSLRATVPARHRSGCADAGLAHGLPAISGFQLRQEGLTRATGFPGAVTLIQRFGSALNLNMHLHMVFRDVVCLPVDGAAPVFRHVPTPIGAELQELMQQIAARIGKVLEQRGLIDRDLKNA